MSIKEKIGSIFPEEESIPEEFRLRSSVIQNEYLVNGQLRVWDGPTQEVLSPVWLISSSGLSRKLLAGIRFSEKESLEALDAAVISYKNGRGIWPSMPVLERIKHIEAFALQMQARKKDIVRLLM
jgi:glyceraldehyde-3-phosphate dehydrogenase (NADP+)